MVAKKKAAKKTDKKGASKKKKTTKKTTKKKAAKNKKRKKGASADPEKSKTSEPEKKQQADIDKLKAVADGNLTPLPVTEPLGKNGKRTRGPDKQPRKPRSDRGQKRDPDLDEKQQADQAQEQPAPTSPQASPAAKAYLTTKALAVTADNTIFKLFPPKMTQMERSAMIDAWTPVVELHIDSIFASPYFVPGLVSVGVLAPRVGAKFRRPKRSAARPKKNEG